MLTQPLTQRCFRRLCDCLQTEQEAADLLHVSRPHLVKLLDEGAIAHHCVGTHRRVRIEDVLAYLAERAERRQEELRGLTRLSQEAEGGYV